jgi:hypothetical protein
VTSGPSAGGVARGENAREAPGAGDVAGQERGGIAAHDVVLASGRPLRRALVRVGEARVRSGCDADQRRRGLERGEEAGGGREGHGVVRAPADDEERTPRPRRRQLRPE